jgi:hypothetical protein
MCDNPATSREHVPPKCIFPERKDFSGQNLREDLITVPSCEVHNSKKSKDDEFLMVSIAGILGNNSIGYRQNMTKVSRAIRRTSNQLLDNAFLKRKHYVVNLEGNAFLEVIWGTPDYKRLENCFEHIALGLFFHHNAKRFKGRLKVVMGHLYHFEKNPATFIQFIKHRAEIDLKDRERFGNNPSVFFYQFTDKDKYGLFLLKMCFYEGVDIFVSFIPDGVMIPPNFAMQLIGGGIKTYLNLGDTSYEFN